MTTKSTSGKNAVRLPDPPQPEDMNNYKFFHSLGNGPHLTNRLGNPETTIVFSEVYLSPSLNSRQADMLVPDLLVAFDVDPAAFDNHNGYVIDQQGKPPDFALEIASHTTGRRDATTKRNATPRWESLNTGASTIRVANTTARPWPETAWSTVFTSQSPLTGLTTKPGRGAAMS